VLAKHPHLDEEVRRRIALHRWDPDIPESEYEKDEQWVKERKKIWKWEKNDHGAHH